MDITRLIQDTADTHDLIVTEATTYTLNDPEGILPRWTRVVIVDRDQYALVTLTITEDDQMSGSVTYCHTAEALDNELASEARHQQLMGYEPTELADDPDAWADHATRLDTAADQVAAREIGPIAPTNWLEAFRRHQNRKATRLRERADASRTRDTPSKRHLSAVK